MTTTTASSKDNVNILTCEVVQGDYQGPGTDDLIKRTESLFTTIQYLIEINRKNNSDKEINNLFVKLNEISDQTFAHIREKLNIEQGLANIAAHKEAARYKYIKDITDKYTYYIRHQVLPKLIVTIKQIYPDLTNQQALLKLNEAENICCSLRKKRTAAGTLINAEWAELLSEFTVAHQTSEAAAKTVTHYFSKQIPIGRLTTAQVEKVIVDTKAQKDPLQKSFANYLSQTQDRNLNLNCYSRAGEGIPALRKTVCGYIGANEEQVVSAQWYRHSSMVPYKVKNAAKRLAMTQRNIQQITEILADDFMAKELQFWGVESAKSVALAATYNSENPLRVPFTEMRLLSPIRKKWAFLDKEQQQYQQILESFLAVNSVNGKTFQAKVKLPGGIEHEIYVKPDIIFFNFGVNRVRHNAYCDPLQDWINTRGFNDLCATVNGYLLNNKDQLHSKELQDIFAGIQQIFAKLNTNERFKELTAKINNGRNSLQAKYADLTENLKKYESGADKENQQSQKLAYQNEIKDIVAAIEQQHLFEAELLTLRKNWWEQNRKAFDHKIGKIRSATKPTEFAATNYIKVLQDFADAQDLYYRKEYNTNENNYWLQTIITRLSGNIGCPSLSGCNDDKDRGSTFENWKIAAEIFYQEYKRYPHFNKPEDRKEMQHYHAIAHRYSSSLAGTEHYSIPGVRGYQIYAGDGNKHLDLSNSHIAKLGKRVYDLPLKLRIADSLSKLKNLFISQKPSPTVTQSQQKPVEQPAFSEEPQADDVLILQQAPSKISLFKMEVLFKLPSIRSILLPLCLMVGLAPSFNLVASEALKDERQIVKTADSSKTDLTSATSIMRDLADRKRGETKKPVDDNVSLVPTRIKPKWDDLEYDEETGELKCKSANDESCEEDALNTANTADDENQEIFLKSRDAHPLPDNNGSSSIAGKRQGFPNTNSAEPGFSQQVISKWNIRNMF